MYENINRLRNCLLKSGLSEPFNIFEICSKYDNLGIETCDFKTPGLRGMVTLAKSEDDINCIIINSNLSYEEQIFHGLHELNHIYFEHGQKGQTFNCFDKVKPNQNSYIEWVANEGAAELLLPYKEVLPFVKEVLPTLEKEMFPILEIIRMLSKSHIVSETVVQNRLNNLKYELYQYLNGVPLDRIQILSKRAQEQKGIHVDTLEQIESNRLMDRISPRNRKFDLSTPFLWYSESYRNASTAHATICSML